MRIAIPVFLALAAASSPAVANGATNPPPALFQEGFNSSSADQTTFDNSQGAAATIFVDRSQQINGGGCHYFWVAAGVKIPGTSSGAVFTQVGYSLCGSTGAAAVPFLLTSGSNIAGGNQWNFYPQYPLDDQTSYTFSFSTDGVQQPDGGYDYQFTVQSQWGNPIVLATIDLDSPNTYAPYAISEINGSSNACADTFSVTYGTGAGDALMAMNGGYWQSINHVVANYWYGPCQDANVAPIDWQYAETQLGLGVTQTTAPYAQVW